MSYEFRKVYADLVTDGGDVCVLYLGWVRLLTHWHGRAGVEIYRADGTRERYGAGSASPPPDADAPLGQIPLCPSLGGGRVELSIEPEHGDFVPGTVACPELTWAVKVARGRARLRAPFGDFEGTGYVDLVRITRPTRRLGLRILSWGRAHLDDATLVFTVTDFADARRWSAGALWTGGHGRGAESPADVRLDADGRGTVTVAADRVALTPERLLHAGDAFGPERVPQFLDRIAARVVTGPTIEARWLGWATDGSHRRGRVVYETVRFGGR